MALETNVKAATSTKAQLAAAGLLTAQQAGQHASSHTSTLQGFKRKTLPVDLPEEPRFWLHSVSEYGETVNIGAGFKALFEIKPCPEGKRFGPGCPINRQYFYEEVVVDRTEFTPLADVQIIDCVMKTGPGMSRDVNRALVGWFVSAFNPPKAEEVDEAHRIYGAECDRLITQANLFYDKKEFNEISEAHKRAAKYRKLPVDWSKPAQQMVDCPGCKESVRAGAILHAAPYCGYVFNWAQAIETGMRKFEDAPTAVQEELTRDAKKKN